MSLIPAGGCNAPPSTAEVCMSALSDWVISAGGAFQISPTENTEILSRRTLKMCYRPENTFNDPCAHLMPHETSHFIFPLYPGKGLFTGWLMNLTKALRHHTQPAAHRNPDHSFWQSVRWHSRNRRHLAAGISDRVILSRIPGWKDCSDLRPHKWQSL